MSNMNNTLNRINNRLYTVEEKISKLGEVTIEIIQNESDTKSKNLL